MTRKPKKSTAGLLSMQAICRATGAKEETLLEGIKSGKLHGWYTMVNGAPYFRPDVTKLIRWSSVLADAMVEGAVGLHEGERLFRVAARRMLLGLDPDPILDPQDATT